MDWAVTLLAIHIFGLLGCLLIYHKAPCWMQKVVVGFLGVGMLVMAGGYAAAIGEMAGFGWWGSWNFFTLGLVIEHIGVLLLVFRLNYQEHLQWKPSSAPSLSLPD